MASTVTVTGTGGAASITIPAASTADIIWSCDFSVIPSAATVTRVEITGSGRVSVGTDSNWAMSLYGSGGTPALGTTTHNNTTLATYSTASAPGPWTRANLQGAYIDYGYTNNNASLNRTGYDSYPTINVTYTMPLPTITSLSVTTGSTAGGTSTVITGTNFYGTPTVTFGGTGATVGTVTATTISVTTPAHAAGSADVVVTNPDGGAVTKYNAFMYQGPAPTYTSVSPTTGSTLGGTYVTITGGNFVNGATVTFRGAAATTVTVVNATTITCYTPAGNPGWADIVVTNPDAQSVTATNAFTYYAPPTFVSVNPTSGPTAGGTSTTISGSGFQSSPPPGATVTFGGTAAISATVVNANTITCTTPAKAAGTYDIVIQNPDSQFVTGASAFTYYAPPSYTSLSPTSGPTAGGTSVTITGGSFRSPATVTFGGTAATSVVVVNATTITCATPAKAAGTYDVVISNPDGQSVTGAAAFTYYAPPSYTSLTPSSGTAAGGTSVTISGGSFLSGSTVTFGGTAATSVVVVNSTTITCVTPAKLPTTCDVVITNPDGQSVTAAGAYTYYYTAVLGVSTYNTNWTHGANYHTGQTTHWVNDIRLWSSLVITAGIDKMSLGIQTANAAAKVKGCIWADSNGVPGALLATTNELVGVVQGMNDLPFGSGTTINPGPSAKVWIGFLSDTTLQIRGLANSGTFYYSSDAYSDGVASTFGTLSNGTNLAQITLTANGTEIPADQISKAAAAVALRPAGDGPITSKAAAAVALRPPGDGANTSKATAYILLSTQARIDVSKAAAYLVLATPSQSLEGSTSVSSTGTIYVVWERSGGYPAPPPPSPPPTPPPPVEIISGSDTVVSGTIGGTTVFPPGTPLAVAIAVSGTALSSTLAAARDKNSAATKRQPDPNRTVYPDLSLPELQSAFSTVVDRTFSERNSADIQKNASSRTPLPARSFSDGIAEEYDRWIRSAHAGQLTANPTGLLSLKVTLQSYSFATWGAAFLVYWQSMTWLPRYQYTTGVVTNAAACAAGLQSDINGLISFEKPKQMSGSPDAFAERIAKILHTYTTKLTVLATLSTTPPSTILEKVH